ncbi:MAG TPA: MFS transporter [Dehalococcoidia bacterium]|nr:MFS transporter [Dehalococcoidia bacterium]
MSGRGSHGGPTPGAAGGRGRETRFDVTAAGLIGVIYLTEAVIGILLLAVNPDYPQVELHAKVLYTGLALSIYFAAKSVGQPLGGWLADRIEPHAILMAGLLLNLPVIVLMERIKEIWFYLGAWAAFGLTLAVVWPTVYAIVGERFRPSVQGRLLALVSMGQIAGTVTGVGIGSVLVDHVSYLAAFVVATVIEAASLLVAVAIVRGGGQRQSAGALGAAQAPFGWRQWASVLTPDAVLLILVIMLLSMAVAMLTPDIGPYRDRILHMNASTFALLLAPPAALAAALLVPSGYLADRAGRNRPLAVGIVIFAASIFLLSFTRSPLVASFFACGAAVGYVLCLPALSASLIDLSKSGNRGLLTGISTAIQAIGGVIGPPIGAKLIDSFGALSPFRGAAAIMAVTFVVALVYIGRTRDLYRRRVAEAVTVSTRDLRQ